MYLFHLGTRENLFTIEAKGKITNIKKKCLGTVIFKILTPFLQKPQKWDKRQNNDIGGNL